MRVEDEERRIRVVLLDIEGTTTPIDFVTKTLFPYATARLEAFLCEHAHEPQIETLVADLRALREADEKAGANPPDWPGREPDQVLSPALAYLRWLIARDSKRAPLKVLQGRIWDEGYARGELHGEVYEDVPRAMARWKQQGRLIAIYSSGSVLAQQLLFSTTKYGDLTQHICGYFDTQSGPKMESTSYVKIAATLGQSAGDVLFLSDAQGEIDAAQSAGMLTALCAREPEPDALAAKAIFSFDDVLPT